MGNCDCVTTQNINGTPTVTSQVVFDGSSLACISFSSGNVNDLATAIATAICTLQSAVASITVDTNGTVLIGINTNCLSIVDGQTVTSALNSIITQVCANTTAIASITTSEVTVTGITTTPNCLGLTNSMTLTQMINQLILVLCHHIHTLPINLPDVTIGGFIGRTMNDYDDGTGACHTPFTSYVKSTFSYTDTSGGGIAKITLPALDYYVDDANVNQSSEQITLTSSSDNYIYQDNQNGWVYNIHAVTIGAGVPTVTGAIICKVETGVGTIASVTQIIANYPINNALLQDSSVMKRNLNTDTVDPAGAIVQNAGAYKSNVDGIGIEIVANKLQLKDDGVHKEKINVDVIGDGLKQNASGALDLYTANSITTSGGKVQLLNDIASGVSKDYGFDENGSLGFHDNLVKGFLVEIAHVDILTLGVTDTPLLAIVCPDGKTVQIIDVDTYTKTGWTTPYATNTDLVVYTQTAGKEQFIDSYILLSSVVRGIKSTKLNVSDATTTQHVFNKDVYIGIKTGDPTGGTDGQILGVRVLYVIS
jgi:hypothetical protein